MTAPQFDFRFDQRDLDRALKRLDKWHGSPLKKRMDKALQAGLTLLVNPIRATAARHTRTGATVRSVKVKSLRKRWNEVAAYSVGPRTWYKHFVIAGTRRGVTADPYVSRAVDPLEGRVRDFVSQQVRDLR